MLTRNYTKGNLFVPIIGGFLFGPNLCYLLPETGAVFSFYSNNYNDYFS